MKRIEILLVLLVVVFTFSGCGGDTAESLTGEMVGLTKELNKELAALKTVDDLKKAESKLVSLGEESLGSFVHFSRLGYAPLEAAVGEGEDSMYQVAIGGYQLVVVSAYEVVP